MIGGKLFFSMKNYYEIYFPDFYGNNSYDVSSPTVKFDYIF
jgi:hypothetical protein